MPSFLFAEVNDIPQVLPMMRDFYAFEHLAYEEDRARQLLARLVADERLGRLILFHSDSVLVGYMVLGFGFSLEFGGTVALVDEFFVEPAHRSSGIGRAAVEFAAHACRALSIRCLQLEADYFNQRAHEFYLRLGFQDHKRHLMTRWLQQEL